LPKKYKLLIGMALDASFETVQGVKSLTRQALEAGCIYTVGQALKELFEERK
jgi:alkylhydroperoxidase/carboxymuconolactone decarboxylase family protein YurZ